MSELSCRYREARDMESMATWCIIAPLGLENPAPIASQRLFSVLFPLSSSPCVSKASSSAAKIPRKLLAVRCEAVFTEQRFVEARKTPQGILSYFQGV